MAEADYLIDATLRERLNRSYVARNSSIADRLAGRATPDTKLEPLDIHELATPASQFARDGSAYQGDTIGLSLRFPIFDGDALLPPETVASALFGLNTWETMHYLQLQHESDLVRYAEGLLDRTQVEYEKLTYTLFGLNRPSLDEVVSKSRADADERRSFYPVAQISGVAADLIERLAGEQSARLEQFATDSASTVVPAGDRVVIASSRRDGREALRSAVHSTGHASHFLNSDADRNAERPLRFIAFHELIAFAVEWNVTPTLLTSDRDVAWNRFAVLNAIRRQAGLYLFESRSRSGDSVERGYEETLRRAVCFDEDFEATCATFSPLMRSMEFTMAFEFYEREIQAIDSPFSPNSDELLSRVRKLMSSGSEYERVAKSK